RSNTMPSRDIRFTGIVATLNEDRRLDECLASLSFCDQLIQVDMGSEDRSVEVGRKFGVELVRHERVAVVEELRSEIVGRAKYDWIIFLDPDEVFPVLLLDEIIEVISSEKTIGSIMIPWKFYFKGQRLDCTVWGGNKHKQAINHRDRVTFTPNVHRGFELKEGYRHVYLEPEEDLFIRHYWIDSYGELFTKHSRYIKREGESRYNIGERFNWSLWIKETVKALKLNLIDYGGAKGGLRGVFLSTFYACYIARSLLSLRRYQRKAALDA
ncbi:MAG: glycosyltransferase, partial [bacterium]